MLHLQKESPEGPRQMTMEIHEAREGLKAQSLEADVYLESRFR